MKSKFIKMAKLICFNCEYKELSLMFKNIEEARKRAIKHNKKTGHKVYFKIEKIWLYDKIKIEDVNVNQKLENEK